MKMEELFLQPQCWQHSQRFFEADLDKMVKMAINDKTSDDSIANTELNSLDEEEIVYYYKQMPEEDKNLTKAIIKEIYNKNKRFG